MLILMGIIIASACLLAVYRWRWGVFAAIAVALLQDPLRKMIPGVPGYLAMASFPVWITVLGMASMQDDLRIHQFLKQFPRLRTWLLLLGGYSLLPLALSLSYGHNTWLIAGLGVGIYGAGFLAVVGGYQFSLSMASVERLMSFYVLFGAVLLVGGVLEVSGLGESMMSVGTEAMGHIWVTYRTGEAVKMISGFFRGPDIMGWHAVMIFFTSSILAMLSRSRMRWVWIGIALWALGNTWLCGRRKIIAMIPVFFSAFLMLRFKFQGPRKMIPVLGAALMLISLIWLGFSERYQATAIDRFYLTTLEEWDEQLVRHGWTSVITTVRQAGFWGYGLGMTQQGIHHIDAEIPRIWQESGPSKLVAEWGVPGSVLVVIVFMVLMITAFRVVQMRRGQREQILYAGLLSLLIANAASAIVSAQIFGDPFVALWLAFLTGVLLSGARTVPVNENVEEPS